MSTSKLQTQIKQGKKGHLEARTLGLPKNPDEEGTVWTWCSSCREALGDPTARCHVVNIWKPAAAQHSDHQLAGVPPDLSKHTLIYQLTPLLKFLC